MAQHKQSRDALETELKRVKRQNDYYMLYLHDKEIGKEPISAKLNKSETEHHDEWIRADWYRADAADEGYVVFVQRFDLNTSPNTWILPMLEMQTFQHDQDMRMLLSRLQHERFTLLRAA